ncbi:MAG: hypothetical protein HY277_06725 [Ignavibacteriales bacterium]|nr:hypothetical protein [Ignavibacteriales bacterium]
MKYKGLLIALLAGVASGPTLGQTINFDNDTEGKTPTGFLTALTGKGKPGAWVVGVQRFQSQGDVERVAHAARAKRGQQVRSILRWEEAYRDN